MYILPWRDTHSSIIKRRSRRRYKEIGNDRVRLYSVDAPLDLLTGNRRRGNYRGYHIVNNVNRMDGGHCGINSATTVYVIV